jgi:hypothetical protein
MLSSSVALLLLIVLLAGGILSVGVWAVAEMIKNLRK